MPTDNKAHDDFINLDIYWPTLSDVLIRMMILLPSVFQMCSYGWFYYQDINRYIWQEFCYILPLNINIQYKVILVKNLGVICGGGGTAPTSLPWLRRCPHPKSLNALEKRTPHPKSLGTRHISGFLIGLQRQPMLLESPPLS